MAHTFPPSRELYAVQTVLSVDDRESSRYIRSQALSAAGFRVIEAATGADAIRLAVEERPSLIVLDVRLPDINGFSVCEQLKSNPRTALIPILHVSAIGRLENDLPTALEHQSDAYLREPIEPETLVATVRALIRTRDAERRARDAEDRARRAERHAALVLESIADPVIAFDRKWHSTYVSQRAAQALGRTPEDLLHQPLQDLYPDDDGTLLTTCERACASHLPATLERFSERSGQWSVAHIYPSENGVSIQWRDITEAKRTEQALRESQERVKQQLAEIEALYETAPVGLCVLDDELRWVRLNRRMAEMNGVPIEAHIGKTPREVLPDLGDQVEAAQRRILETGEPLLDFEITGTSPAEPGIVRSWNERWLPL
ncbi:MAG TPA: PAS domain-containing protein, partial [Bryobacteraceae bacterium]|nr:PAS domain-containing protein [Bryobacteraceae bacterium]